MKHRLHYAQFKNSKDLIIFGHFLYQIFFNPRKNVENTENFIYVIFIVLIFLQNSLMPNGVAWTLPMPNFT
jgi:hypothetical protein